MPNEGQQDPYDMQFTQTQDADRIEFADSVHSPGITQDICATGMQGRIIPVALSRDQRLREAVLLCFSDSHRLSFDHLLSAGEWNRLVAWLDVSGLALYFLDRITQTGQHSFLPASVLHHLQNRLGQNRQRTRGMIEESIGLQRGFQSAGLSYAVMKGISLSPICVTDPGLRHQFDLDFLIADADAPAARQVLERHGYTLFSMSGNTWEFKKGQTPYVSANDLYRDLPYRGVELHLETNAPDAPMRLHRRVFRKIYGFTMPVFSPPDLFLGQAMHVAKDICSPFLRGSHLLEFYRHVVNHHDDDGFWDELRMRAHDDRRACLGMGVAVYLITSVWGEFAPHALTSWTSERLPAPVQLWLELYGRASILQIPPGSKRYLRLQQEMDIASGMPRQSSKISILNGDMPLVQIQGVPGENLLTQAARYRIQLRFLVSRACFHIVEGIRFIAESRRWHRLRRALP
jgi:hypothetical protein